MSWSRRFDTPIMLPGGAKLETLDDARRHLAAAPIPEGEAERAALAIAIELLMDAAGGVGFLMFAHIAVARAAGVQRNGGDVRRKRARAFRIIG